LLGHHRLETQINTKQMKKILIYILLLLGSSQLFAKTILVANESAFANANKQVLAGDTILLKSGFWDNCTLEITATGTVEKPIVIKAEISGKTIISGRSILRIGGEYVIVEGLLFTNGYAKEGSAWEFRVGKTVANHCRITNCMIKSFNNLIRKEERYWVSFYGQHNRIDHCNFIDKTNLGVLIAVILEDDRSRLNFHSIDSNYFGVRKPLGSNAGEIIRVGVSQHCTFNSNTNIHHNYFYQCDGETEIISIKSCGNLVHDNVFQECQGTVVLRHGNNNTIEHNLFLGNGKEGTGGVRIINEGNWVVGNYFYECRGDGFRSPLAIMNGVFHSPAYRYLPVRDAVFAHNTYNNCTAFGLGEGNDAERTVAPANVFFFNNLFYNNKDTTLCNIYSNTDSIFCKGNIISNTYGIPSLKGFEQKTILRQYWDGNAFPFFLAKHPKNNLPKSLSKEVSKRLLYGFPKSIGCATTFISFKELFDNANKMGVYWKLPEEVAPITQESNVPCKNAEEVYAALNTPNAHHSIQLTGTNYTFEKPINIESNTSFIGDAKMLVFASSSSLECLFRIKGANKLDIDNLDIDASNLQVKDFIVADGDGKCVHASLSINKMGVSKLTANSFFTAEKNAYLDEITVRDCFFSNDSCSLFSLKDERDDKGFYNVEKISINHCSFTKNKGELLTLYRGGNDESTMGPKLYFEDNKIVNNTSNNGLIDLMGVQRSFIRNNYFENSSIGNNLILYKDKVKASHILKNNTISNCGSIVENQFVSH